MIADTRRLAVTLVGFCAFMQLYAPQSLLPMFAAEFNAAPATAGLMISATAVAVAATAPFAGAVADRLGRRVLMVSATLALVIPTLLLAFAQSLDHLVALRFVQGLLLPPIFTVAIAYIGDEWPPEQVTGIIGFYIAGSALGGFLGRFITGLVADHAGWRAAFAVMAAINLAGALGIARWLPRERNFRAAAGMAASLRAMAGHLTKPLLLATFGAGLLILFVFVAAFTYVSFHLAAPPFSLSPGALGAIFIVYLAGVVTSPWTGPAVRRLGRRRLALTLIGVWIAGVALTLIPWLPAIVGGLAITAACGFVCQTLANGFINAVAGHARSSAVGLYATAYYVGGGLGGVLPGVAYAAAGWPSVVAMIVAALVIMGALAGWAWGKA